VELTSTGESRRYYYPGSWDREHATVVKISHGEAAQIEEFRLPQEIQAGTIEGVVRHFDGEAAAGAIVIAKPAVAHHDTVASITPEDRLFAKADSTGHFALPVLQGLTYEVRSYGRALQAEHGTRFANPLKVTVDRDTTTLSLVLSAIQ
jgi:hypothetical protein